MSYRFQSSSIWTPRTPKSNRTAFIQLRSRMTHVATKLLNTAKELCMTELHFENLQTIVALFQQHNEGDARRIASHVKWCDHRDLMIGKLIQMAGKWSKRSTSLVRGSVIEVKVYIPRQYKFDLGWRTRVATLLTIRICHTASQVDSDH